MNIFLIVWLIVLVWCFVGLFGNELMLRRLDRLINAVHAYNLHCIANNEPEKTIRYFSIKTPSFWDCPCPWKWSYENLMDADKLEIIKEFIGETNED